MFGNLGDLPKDDRLLTVRQICTEFNVGRTTVYDAINTGALRTLRLGKRAPRCRLADVIAWIRGLPPFKPKK